MRIKEYIFGLMVIILCSCSGKNEVPQGILQPQKMKMVLWDMLRVQNLSKELTMNDTILTPSVETKILTQKVFEVYDIDSAVFEKSYNWYLKNPVLLKRIVDSLYVQKQRENAEKQVEPPVPVPEEESPQTGKNE